MPASSPEASLDKELSKKRDEAVCRRKSMWECRDPEFLQKRTEMDTQQSTEMKEWKDAALLGLAEHELAARYYTGFSFFCSALPNMAISALVSVLVLLADVPHRDIVVAALSSVSGILTTIAAFFKWQGEAEKHRAAAKEYNMMMERIDYYAAERDVWLDDMAHRAEIFIVAQKELHSKRYYIKRQVQPAPAWIRNRAASDLSTLPYEEKRSELRKSRLYSEREKEQLRNLEPKSPAVMPSPRVPATPRTCYPRTPHNCRNDTLEPKSLSDEPEAEVAEKRKKRTTPNSRRSGLRLPAPFEDAAEDDVESGRI